MLALLRLGFLTMNEDPTAACRGGGMADAADLKFATLTGVWVRVPPSAPTVLATK